MTVGVALSVVNLLAVALATVIWRGLPDRNLGKVSLGRWLILLAILNAVVLTELPRDLFPEGFWFLVRPVLALAAAYVYAWLLLGSLFLEGRRLRLLSVALGLAGGVGSLWQLKSFF